MFRIRDPQESLWQSQFLVTPKKTKRLERSWAEVFRNEALPLIYEERFAPMYCVDNGRPNRAVQTVLGVHLLKEMFNLTDDDWGNVGGGNASLDSKRFGAEPPQSMVNLHSMASHDIINACGLNIALFGEGNAAATREAWRLALFGVLSPLGKLVESELRYKLEDSVTLSWQELRASDLSGRARAFQSMVGGGLDIEKAISVAGLMVEDDDM